MYKRQKGDNPVRCPYCTHGFRMTDDRYLRYNRRLTFGWNKAECRECGKTFMYRNFSAKMVRDTGLRAVMTMEEFAEEKGKESGDH